MTDSSDARTVATTADPPASLINVVTALFGGAGPQAAADAAKRLGDDLVMIEGGENLRSGLHEGKPAMGALMARIQAETDDFASDLEWVVGDDKRVFSLSHAHGTRKERTIDTKILTVISADDDGQIVEIRDLPYDWTAWEKFWA